MLALSLLRPYTLLSCLSTLYSVCASQWVGLISSSHMAGEAQRGSPRPQTSFNPETPAGWQELVHPVQENPASGPPGEDGQEA